MVERLIQLSVSTIGGCCFDLKVQDSCRGIDVKHLLSTMDSALRVSMMRLLHGVVEIQDDLPISTTIKETRAQLVVIFRSHACEQFLLCDYDWDRSLETASDEVRGDKQCVLSAVNVAGEDLRYASPELRNDKDVVLAAVRHSGSSLTYAGEELRDDIDVVRAALQSDPSSIRHASSALQDDIDVVLAAICQSNRLGNNMLYPYAEDACSLFASERLRDLPEVVLLDTHREPELKFLLQRAFWVALLVGGFRAVSLEAIALLWTFTIIMWFLFFRADASLMGSLRGAMWTAILIVFCAVLLGQQIAESRYFYGLRTRIRDRYQSWLYERAKSYTKIS